MDVDTRDVIRLKAAIEFGSENDYSIKNGGLGPTLVIDAHTREHARKVREKVPTTWEDLYTLVIYNSAEEDYEEDPYAALGIKLTSSSEELL
jgi:molybdopterin-biosynthesis enzyme MoeA-like protein